MDLYPPMAPYFTEKESVSLSGAVKTVAPG